jgi:hypothetical protein
LTAEEKLQAALHLLERALGVHIGNIELFLEQGRIKTGLVDGTIVYVQFNDHGEYAYMVRFSYLSNDACRFDNYDNTWKVQSMPHHFHPRYLDDGFQSPMTGMPEHDIPILCGFIVSGALKGERFRP